MEVKDDLENAMFSVIAVPFNFDKTEQTVFVKVRELSDIQIQAIGDISLIEVDAPSRKFEWRKYEKFAELQNKIVRASLVSPTYDEILGMIGKDSFQSDCEARYKEIQKEIIELPKGPLKKLLEQQAVALRVLFDLVLPNDFTSAIVEYALGTKKTDIKLVTKKILLDCALLQHRCGGRPSDYCSGIFSDFNKRDIDVRALIEYDKYIKENGGK